MSDDAETLAARVPEPRALAASPPLRGRLRRAAISATYPLTSIVLGLLLIEVVARVFDIAPYLLPRPSRVFSVLLEQWPMLLRNSWPTLQAIGWGFLLSIAVAVPLAVAIASSRLLERFIYPLLVVSQTVPKIALAPVLVIWFGFGLAPKVLIAFLIAFFPITIDTVVGLRSVPQEMIHLARSMQSSALSTFWRIRFPFALPSLFGGLKVAVTLAVTGAVVGEFIGSDRGLGHVIIVASGRLQADLVFAAVVMLVAIGMVAFWAVSLVERAAVPWHTSMRAHEAAPDARSG